MSNPQEASAAAALIQSHCGADAVSLEENTLLVPAERLFEVCRLLKGHASMAYDYLSNLAAVDYPPETMEVVYTLYSILKRSGPLALKVRLKRAECHVASVTPLWRGAEFQEREAYDLYGVCFNGHPDLRRILLWEGFEGHPMRKDYVVEDQDKLETPQRGQEA
jgi:NADH/F420H2 dehydrogenase subunit C